MLYNRGRKLDLTSDECKISMFACDCRRQLSMELIMMHLNSSAAINTHLQTCCSIDAANASNPPV